MTSIAKSAAVLLAWAAGWTTIGCGPGSDERTSSSAAETPSSSPKDAPDPGTFEAELLKLVNSYRTSLGLGALSESAALRDVARDHSVDMITQQYFAHLSPFGLTAGGRVSTAGISWTSVGENLAEGLATPRSVYEAWMLSPLHRENLERADWTQAGVGVAVGEEGHVVTQLFLRP